MNLTFSPTVILRLPLATGVSVLTFSSGPSKTVRSSTGKSQDVKAMGYLSLS